MNPVKVYIASTAAPVAIQRIAREQGIDPGVYINRGTKPSCISDDYYYFVNKGSGVIERRVGFTDFRADLESEISGMSWPSKQLSMPKRLGNSFNKTIPPVINWQDYFQIVSNNVYAATNSSSFGAFGKSISNSPLLKI